MSESVEVTTTIKISKVVTGKEVNNAKDLFKDQPTLKRIQDDLKTYVEETLADADQEVNVRFDFISKGID